MRKEERIKVGVVNYEVLANTKESQRKGSLMIAGKVFSVTQSKKTDKLNHVCGNGLPGSGGTAPERRTP